jgi:hypothetical protein
LLRGIVFKAKKDAEDGGALRAERPIGSVSAERLAIVGMAMWGEVKLKTRYTHQYTGEPEIDFHFTPIDAIRIKRGSPKSLADIQKTFPPDCR